MASNKNKTCAVSTCNSPKNVSYHTFPKELDIRSIWIQRCKRNNKLNPNTSRICQEHFTLNDYERDLKNELLGLPQVHRLKKGAVPSLNIPGGASRNEEEEEDSNAQSELLPHEHKSFIEDILKNYQAEREAREESNASQGSSSSPSSVEKDTKDDLRNASSNTNNLGEGLHWKQKFLRLQTNHNALKAKSNLLQQDLRTARSEIRRLKSKRHQKEKVQEFLRSKHSSNQVKKIMNPESKFCHSYDHNEMTTSLVLRYINNRAFEYLRSKNILPLPSKRTQKRWLSEAEPGLLEDYLKIIQGVGRVASKKTKKSEETESP